MRRLGPIKPHSKVSTLLHKGGKFNFTRAESVEMDLYLLEASVELEVSISYGEAN